MATTSRTFEVMQYMEYMTCSYDDIVSKLQSGDIEHLTKWAIVLHDSDLKDDGSPKPLHFHCVLVFSQPKTFKTVADLFGVEIQYVNKIKTTTKAALMYLCHKNDKTKFQYTADKVTASFDYIELFDDTPAVDNIKNILDDIDKEVIKPYNIQNYVSIQTYSKYKRTFDTAFDYVIRKKRGLNRNMKCFYFYGTSGSGKTTYAKMFAAQNGWSTFVSSGGKNPLDDYNGEDCIILDDIRGSLFSLADFLKLTDNNTDSMVGCRYYNKSIVYCKAIICTSVISLEDLYNGVTDKQKEPLKQLIRRFETVIKFDDDKLTFMMPNADFDALEPKLKVVNPVKALFDREVAKRTAENMAKAMGLEIIGSTSPEEEFMNSLDFDDKPF